MIELPPYASDGGEQQPVHDYAVVLDGTEYRLKIHYRERNDRWYLSIYDADDEALLLTKKLSIDTRLLVNHVIDGLPPGDFILIDTSGSDVECGWDDFGTRCALVYIEESELPAAAVDPSLTIEAVP